MKIRYFLFAAACSLLLLSSCQTYYIPLDSFKQQFEGLDTSGLRRVVTKDPWGGRQTYKTYRIDSVLCIDKNGNKIMLKNSPSLEVRITDNENRRTIFYFDLMRVSHDTITGIRSRFIPSLKRSIPLSRIKTIEIQNGGKKFSYIK